MARKSAPGTLIHCDACGEDYSATYKRCPFCGEKPEKQPTAPLPPLDEDDYVFDGGDVFEDDEDSGKPAASKGGKRLAQEDAPGPINWPRLITFICSLLIIAAALIIVFVYIYPKIHNPSSNPSGPINGSVVSQNPESAPPAESDPGDITDDPDADPTGDPSGVTPGQESVPPADTAVTGLSLDKEDVTLTANESFTLQATVTPADWGGTVTWSSSDTNLATVSANGTVTNVNTGSSKRSVTITATAGGQTASCIVRCSGGSSGAAASSSNPSGGSLTLSREDLTLNDTWPTYTFTVTGASGSVSWSISDSSVAAIDQNGKVSKVSSGTCTVTATDSDGRTATCIVRVK